MNVVFICLFTYWVATTAEWSVKHLFHIRLTILNTPSTDVVFSLFLEKKPWETLSVYPLRIAE